MLLLPIYTDDAVQTVGGRDSIAVICLWQLNLYLPAKSLSNWQQEKEDCLPDCKSEANGR